MGIWIFTYMYKSMYICVHMCLGRAACSMNMRLYLHVHVYLYMCMYMYIHTYTYIYLCINLWMYVYTLSIRVYLHIGLYAFMYTCACVCINIYIYTYTVHVCMYVQQEVIPVGLFVLQIPVCATCAPLYSPGCIPVHKKAAVPKLLKLFQAMPLVVKPWQLHFGWKVRPTICVVCIFTLHNLQDVWHYDLCTWECHEQVLQEA